MADVIRIVMADDHPVVRRGLRLSIEEHPQIKVIGEAGDGNLALEMIRELHPDIAVLDVDMPGMDGFEVARQVRRLGLTTNIMFLTLHTDEDFLQAAFDCGGQAYLLKDSVLEEIVAGILAVHAGKMYVSPSMTKLLVKRRVPAVEVVRETTPAIHLTPSERRIMDLIADGKSSKEIGDALSIHYRTVENHRTHICKKLGIEGSNALLRFALQNKSVL
ncbi:response regulator transcription factor [soil metagenome]